MVRTDNCNCIKLPYNKLIKHFDTNILKPFDIVSAWSSFMEKRLYQHSYHLRKGNKAPAPFCQNSIEQHSFDLYNCKIVHRCDCTLKRKVLESLYINVKPTSINSQTDVDMIS